MTTITIPDLLSEAAVEIENLDGPRNVVAKRLRSQLRTTTIEVSDTAGNVALAAIAHCIEHCGQPEKLPALKAAWDEIRAGLLKGKR